MCLRCFQLIIPLTISLTTGCATVANVAQTVADSARGSGSSTTEAPKAQGSPVADQQGPCATNFSVTGSFFSGKQFKSQAPLPNLAPDLAYRKAYTEVVNRGWQIISVDKEIRMISASQGVSFSSGGKTVPVNIHIRQDGGRGSSISFTLSLTGGLVTSEEGVRDGFCKFVNDITKK